MTLTELRNNINNGTFDSDFISKCGISKSNLINYKNRILELTNDFEIQYDNECTRDVHLYSVGGRSELSGNHTDHNHGKVIAGAVNLDIIAIASKNNDGIIRLKSKGFDEDIVLPNEIMSPNPNNFFKSKSIIAGMENGFISINKKIGGFDCCTTSNILKGSGLSSSAAFEVMVGNIINHLYNNGEIDNVTIAKLSQHAENIFFGKPCGLMDQTACAVGGLVSIDFKDPANPLIEKISLDLEKKGYALCIVNTGGNHADLNDDYASIPIEMKSVAKFFGKNVLRECTKDQIFNNAEKIRKECGDRALLRAIHFFDENSRVDKQVSALKNNDIDSFFKIVNKSGDSSYKYLQNVYTIKNVCEQGLSIALCITDDFLKDKKGAYRVHGGGFAGTIQAYIPLENINEYNSIINRVLGDNSSMPLSIRPAGAIQII